MFWNGLGGFTPDGREYVIAIDAVPTLPPAPWTNVLANPGFGCLVTEAGLGYTWAGNSQMNRLTPWSNDPVSDPPGEVVYLRDEETGEVWTPTPLPAGPARPSTVRHGQGYTRYTRQSHGLEQELLVLVPPDDPVKLVRLTRAQHRRPAPATVGDVLRRVGARDRPGQRATAGRVRARRGGRGRPGPQRLGGRASPAGSPSRPSGRGRTPPPPTGPSSWAATARRPHPAALGRAGLSGRAGPALDPCAALMTPITLAPGQTEEVVFVLGQADTPERVRQLAATYTAPGRARQALAEVQALWDRVLGAVQVRTPDPALDLMVNRWLLYQVLACRVWGRSAFYQSGGAYGFRDQLQDVMALVYGAPDEARAQILRAAARQFEEGDVQHWWHPPAGAGVRTRITDDLLFLPLAVHHYVTATGDAALLDERVPFLKAPVLRPDQEEDYSLPAVSEQVGHLYEHCVRALEHGYRLGPHGLPLDGHRRLERRHEQGRRRRQGRERLERLVLRRPC